MIATTSVFLLTVAAQVGAAFYNNRRSKAHGVEMARKQQAFEEKAAKEGIARARAEFSEMCAFQRQLEVEIQRDRLQLISQNHQSNITLEAYNASLENWPLLVPPYVIKNESVFNLGTAAAHAIPLNCILTASSDGNFNKAVYFGLEENIAEFCSKYWNVSANKSIRFLQGTWRDTFSDADTKRKNLYVHLEHVPTLVLSPVIKNDKLIFRIYWWGLSPDEGEVHINGLDEFDPEISIPVCRAKTYSDYEVSQILDECTCKVSAFISYFADLYYWNFYKEAPSLPSLVNSHIVNIPNSDVREYNKLYSSLFDDFGKKMSMVKNVGDVWRGFAPCLDDKKAAIDILADYINSLPEASQCEQLPLLRELVDSTSDSAQRRTLENSVQRLDAVQSKANAAAVNWKVFQSEQFDILSIIRLCAKALPSLPACDRFNIVARKDKLMLVVYFTNNDEVVSWGDLGVWVFQCNKLLCPTEMFGVEDRFSCTAESLPLVEQIIEKNMNSQDIESILDGQYDQLKKELRPLASKIEDLLRDYIDRVKQQVAKEAERKDIDQMNRKELKYEDIINWLRKAKGLMGSQPFDGAFLTKERAGIFDKYANKMYVCLTKAQKPLTEPNHPKCVIVFDTTDDTLDDLFGKNTSMQLNFK